jgi:hypothetical protein
MWTTYVFGPLYALLPRRFRQKFHRGSDTMLSRATTISGVLEFVVALGAMRAWYMHYFLMLADKYVRYVNTTEDKQIYTQEAVSQAGFVAFLFTPLTWIILFFIGEGLVRTFMPLATDEAFPSFPFFAVDYLYRLATRRSAVPELPLVRDEISAGDAACDLRISSCRRKLDWKHPYTIRYGGAFFQVVGEQANGGGPRPYVYRLRRLAPGDNASGLRDYDPDDVLHPRYQVERLG